MTTREQWLQACAAQILTREQWLQACAAQILEVGLPSCPCGNQMEES